MTTNHYSGNIDILEVGDRVRKYTRRDGTGIGTVIKVENVRSSRLPMVTVRFDTGSERMGRSPMWEKIR